MSEASETQRRDVSFLRSSSKVSGKDRVRLRTLTGGWESLFFPTIKKEDAETESRISVVWMSTQSFYIGSLAFKNHVNSTGRILGSNQG